MEQYKFISDNITLSDTLVDPKNKNSLLQSKLKIGWECSKCNKEWYESIISRKRYEFCPECQTRKSNRLCLECNTMASYNYSQYDWAGYCITHKEKDMINIRSRGKIEEKFCDGECDSGEHVGGGRYVCPHNNLSALYPDIVKEWDYDKNDIDPVKVKPGSGKKVYWKCDKGHEWQARVTDRSKNRTKCPYCIS